MSVAFSANLSALRRDRNLSQKQAAEELGISQALLSHYEKGIRECNLDFVKKVADYYDVTADYLLGLTDSKQKMSELFDTQAIPADYRMIPKTVIRSILYLSQQAEENDDSMEIFFTDFFTLCIKKFLAAVDGNAELRGLCDVSINRLCERAPKRDDEAAPPLFSKTVNDHAMMLINTDVTKAFQ
ncbi:MAG: helix-turn-helix transcriptional regulator [Clostridia bacterium]|nr:helix-turn-helix transcriptional regulator [Clostridia bacterium]